MKTEGILEKLQDAIEKRLLALSELRNVPILTYKQSDLHSVIEANVKTGIGVVIVLMPPIPSHAYAHVVGPIFHDVTIEIKIVENTAMNKLGKSLLSLAEIVMQHLHMWHPNILDENYQLELSSGPQNFKVTREDNINYFSMCFGMPCHLKFT
ncbi:MAG: hypothetical protein LBS22_00890 [Puniceicoccales bacterium]|jgi:hypothetical protein|nr:hypothetical protein [Puniceicoccales bacterium]